jgi:hypothetical protein
VSSFGRLLAFDLDATVEAGFGVQEREAVTGLR